MKMAQYVILLIEMEGFPWRFLFISLILFFFNKGRSFFSGEHMDYSHLIKSKPSQRNGWYLLKRGENNLGLLSKKQQ